MRLLRCTLVLLVATTGALAAGALLLPAAVEPGPATFDALLVRCCGWVALGCVGWGWAATAVAVGEAVVLADRAPARRAGLPAGVRRLVLAGCGVALTAGAAPAFAAGGSDAPHAMPPVVAGLPFPDRATDETAMSARTVVVRPGDSLWAITARHLPEDASDRAVTDGWHRLYARNRAAVGDDPSLIHPGQRLALPHVLEEQ